MQTFVNIDTHTRIWASISVPETGATLELAPGEQVDLDLPKSFDDPYLKLEQPSAHIKVQPRKSQGAKESTQATSAAETSEE
jgi:hypothetical protein